MTELIENFNSALDEMIADVRRKSDLFNSALEERWRREPELLAKYNTARQKAFKWINEHPFQCPPDAEFFLK